MRPLGSLLRWACGADGARARRLTTVMALLIAAASYFPFQLGNGFPSRVLNGASLRADGALVIDGPSIVRSVGSPEVIARAIELGSLDVSVTATPASPGQRGPARIVTHSDGPYRRNFMIAQKGADLIVRVRRAESDENGAAPLKVDGVWGDGLPHRIDLRVRPDVIEVLVDGQPRYRDPQETSPFALWRTSAFRLAVGNEVTGHRRFDGVIAGLTLTAGELVVAPLDDPGQLDFPETYWHVPERFQEMLAVDPSHLLVIAATHGAAFALLGALMWCGARRRRGGRTLVAIGVQAALFGAVVQLGKLAFEARHPSLAHAIPDGLGAVLGAMVARRLLRT